MTSDDDDDDHDDDDGNDDDARTCIMSVFFLKFIRVKRVSAVRAMGTFYGADADDKDTW